MNFKELTNNLFNQDSMLQGTWSASASCIDGFDTN